MLFHLRQRPAPKIRPAGKTLALLALMLAGALAPAAGICAEKAAIYVSNAAEENFSSTFIPRVQPFVRNNRSYLFLPGCWDRTSLAAYIGENGDETAEIKGKGALKSGELTDAFAAEQVTLRTAGGNTALYVMQGSKIPCIFIETQSGSVSAIHKSKQNSEPGRMAFYHPNGSARYIGDLSAIRTRGNSTVSYEKPPYQIKLASAADLTGSGKAKTFVLLAEYLDFSLLRNRITLAIARYAQLPYAVHALSVDLYINGVYRGVYTLADKVEINQNRVEIKDLQPEMEYLNPLPLSQYKGRTVDYADHTSAFGYQLDASPADISGGYLLEIDKAHRVRDDANGSVFTSRKMGIRVREPGYPSMEQISYLHDLIIKIDNSIRQKDGRDPQTDVHFSSLIDMPSFAKKFLIEEISINFDAKAGSQYFFKDRDAVSPKVFAGPAWDYDLSYGNCLVDSPGKPYLFTMGISFPWYNTLFQKQEAFRQEVRKQYFACFQPALQILIGQRESENPAMLRSLAEYENELSCSAAMNAVRWPLNYAKKYSLHRGYNFESSIRLLGDFLEKRMAFLDSYLGNDSNIE